MAGRMTATETELESEGVTPTRHYQVRADQLADGSYRYALENPDTGEVLAEGVERTDTGARERFAESIVRSGLSPDEVERLTRATTRNR